MAQAPVVRWSSSVIAVLTNSFQLIYLYHQLRLNLQVVTDPYDIRMGDPRAGESVADYDKYVFSWQLRLSFILFFLLYCFQLISYNMRPTCHQQVIINESERELEESKRWKRLYLAYRGIPIIRTFRKLNENLKNRLLQKSGVKLQCLTKGGRFVIYWSC